MLQDVTLLCTRARERTYLSFSNSGETIVLGDLTYLYMVSHKYLHKLNILFTSHLFHLGLIEVSRNNIFRKKYEADLWKKI
jgi:hypothetical protein